MIARTCSSYSLFVARRVVSGPSGRTIGKEKKGSACVKKERENKKGGKEKGKMKRRRERNNNKGGRKIAILCFAFERRAVSPVRKATSSTSCSLIVNRFGGGLRRTISFT